MSARATEPRPPSPELSKLAFADAGDDSDLREAFERDQRRTAAHEADQLLREAHRLVREPIPSTDPQQRDKQRSAAEKAARSALTAFRDALDYAEDSEDEDAAHVALDAAGRWVRTTFGCHLEQDGSTYQRTCPVDLGHNRLGLSIGGPAVRKCSLCGDHLSECPHIQGRAYMVPGGSDGLGWCRVCGQETCEHSSKREYRVGVIAIITKINLEEVSFVSKPAQPTARIQSVPMTAEDLRYALGDDFAPGMPVSCDKCLTSCGGLRKYGRRLSREPPLE